MELSRHQRRMLLVQAIFLWESSVEQKDADPQHCIQYIWENFSPTAYTDDFSDFDKERFFGMIDHIDEIRETLTQHAPDWPLEKIASSDRAVLYLGLYELLFSDVPPPVVINESVELAKAFGGERSSQFVNGVLSTVMKTQKKEKAPKKSS